MHARPWAREHTCMLVSAPHVAAAEEVLILDVDEMLGASDGRNVRLLGRPITRKVTVATQPLELALPDGADMKHCRNQAAFITYLWSFPPCDSVTLSQTLVADLLCRLSKRLTRVALGTFRMCSIVQFQGASCAPF